MTSRKGVGIEANPQFWRSVWHALVKNFYTPGMLPELLDPRIAAYQATLKQLSG
jgi:hypothetical protein